MSSARITTTLGGMAGAGPGAAVAAVAAAVAVRPMRVNRARTVVKPPHG